jgi:DNA-binding XRE family transcriptional regulator
MALKDDKAQGEAPKPRKKPGPVPGPNNPAIRKAKIAAGELPEPIRGRPSSFEPIMCDLVIEMGKQGMSKTEMACELDISRDTFNEWSKQHESFSAAVKRAMLLSQAWWEKQGRTYTFSGGPMYNATSYIFQMKNRFREEWNDTRVNNNTNEDGPARAKATAEDRSRTLELLGRLGLGASPVGTGSGAEREGADEFSVVHSIDRRSGRAS